MTKFFSIIFTFMFSFILTVPSFASEEIMLKKIDYFSIIVDQSGSMKMSDEINATNNQMTLAKKVIKNVVNYIPEISYDSYMTLASKDVELVNEPFDKSVLVDNVDNIKDKQKIFGRMTNLQTSIQSENERGVNARKKAVILVTDGDWNRGVNPVDCVKELYKNNENCVVHVISLADTKHGEETISEIVRLNADSIVVPAESLLNEETAKEFVEYVFYGYYEPIVIQFDFDKSDIRDSELEKFEEFNNIDLLYDEVSVNGYTCTIGTESYNQKLSERRAESVAKKLNVTNINGFGESTKYTEIEKNRRAEIILR